MNYVRVGSTCVALDRNARVLRVSATVPEHGTERPCKASWTRKRTETALEAWFIDAPVTRRNLARLSSKVATVAGNFLKELNCGIASLKLVTETVPTLASESALHWLGVREFFDTVKPKSKASIREWRRRTKTALTQSAAVTARGALVRKLLEQGEHVVRELRQRLSGVVVPITSTCHSAAQLADAADFLVTLFELGREYVDVDKPIRANQCFLEAVERDVVRCDGGATFDSGKFEEWDVVRHKHETLERQMVMLLHDTRKRLGSPQVEVEGESFVVPRALQRTVTKLAGCAVTKLTKTSAFFVTAELREHVTTTTACKERQAMAEASVVAEFPSLKKWEDAVAAFVKFEIAVAVADAIARSPFVWCVPTLGTQLRFASLVHPCVHDCVSVDVAKENNAAVVTGFNSTGKSTLLRAIGSAVVLHQTIGMVPAGGATMPIMERLFARAGANDALGAGCSTFVTQLAEVSDMVRALETTSGNTMALFDELGANTNEAEGFALAIAIVRHCTAQGTHTFWATHFPPAKIREHVDATALTIDSNHRVRAFEEGFCSNGWEYCVQRGFVS